MCIGARACIALSLLSGTADVLAQAGAGATGDRLDGFVLPVEPVDSDITLTALRAWAWDVGDTSRLLLEGEVEIAIGGYEFRGPATVVWINRISSAQGPINQLAAYFDELENPAKRSGLGMSGRRLLVTGSARGTIKLDVALLRREPPPPKGLMAEAGQRLAAYLRRLNVAPPPLAQRPQVEPAPSKPPVLPTPGGSPPPELAVVEEPTDVPPPVEAPPPIFEPGGTVWFSWQDAEITSGADENVITATGSVVIQYISDRQDAWSQLTISADRAVVFTDPGDIVAALGGRLSADSVRGIYLEGNVIATAGVDEYTIRAPRVYYDLRTDRAIMLEAVLRTYSRAIGETIYARARELRQIAANQWIARRAKVSTSEFFTPHLAVGASRVTVTQRPSPRDPQDTDLFVESVHNTVEAGGVPFLYWPYYVGNVEDEMPLKRIEGGYNGTFGAVFRTRWNPFSLLGLERPDGVHAEVSLDGFTKRGPAAGLDATYDLKTMSGALDLYGLHDTGVDRTSSGRNVKPDSPWRGQALWEHQMEIAPNWSFQGQASYISDETFVTSWRPRDFFNRREYETTGYVNYQDDRSAFDFLLKYNLNNFISNSYLLASRAYQVQKVPEVTYRRYGDSLFDVVTYSGETRAGRVKFSFQSGTPAQAGVLGRAFPSPPPRGPGSLGGNDSITASFLAAGYPSEWVSRFDTRHELSVPLSFGAVHMVPYVAGRLTAYDNDFQSFSTDAERLRYFAAAGLRMSAEIQQVNNNVESRLWDLHRIRHILEPRATLWYGYSNVPDGSYPVYDEEVESIGGAAVAELGLRSTWQTKRGGPGRWRSVDFLTIDASAVFNSGEAFIEGPTPHFYSYRPEYSRFGNHVFGSLMWLLSDSFSVASEATYNFDTSKLARFSIGTHLKHSPVFSTAIEYRYIEAGNSELLGVGLNYQIAKKYRLAVAPQWDLRTGKFRRVILGLTRSFPDFSLNFIVIYDDIRDETTFGLTLDVFKWLDLLDLLDQVEL